MSAFHACSLWGMTESLQSTSTEPSRAREKSPTTDGRPLEGKWRSASLISTESQFRPDNPGSAGARLSDGFTGITRSLNWNV